MDIHFAPARKDAPSRHAGDDVAAFLEAQRRVLDRYDVTAQRRSVEVPTIGGQAQVLVAGEGPLLVLVIGGLSRRRSGSR
ncbi:MAG: hypothetical protein WBL35_12945 [Ornithinibacter sp.]